MSCYALGHSFNASNESVDKTSRQDIEISIQCPFSLIKLTFPAGTIGGVCFNINPVVLLVYRCAAIGHGRPRISQYGFGGRSARSSRRAPAMQILLVAWRGDNVTIEPLNIVPVSHSHFKYASQLVVHWQWLCERRKPPFRWWST